MQEPPFQRTAEVLHAIAAELWLFRCCPLPPALAFLLSTSCFPSPPLSPAGFPPVAEIHTRQRSLPPRPTTCQAGPADRRHVGAGRWDLPEESAESCGPSCPWSRWVCQRGSGEAGTHVVSRGTFTQKTARLWGPCAGTWVDLGMFAPNRVEERVGMEMVSPQPQGRGWCLGRGAAVPY